MFRAPAAITMTSASAGLAALVAAIDAGETEVSLDALVHADSSAVAVMLAARRHAESTGRSIRFTGLPASLHSLAALYGVDSLIAAPSSAAPRAT